MMINAEEKQFSRLDNQLARFLSQRTRLDDKQKRCFEEWVATLSSELSQGHSCIRIDEKTQELMQASGLVSQKDPSPLILEEDRLYLRRYWCYENRLATQIHQLTQRVHPSDNFDRVLAHYFQSFDGQTDWQREAAKLALTHSFSIITGGPGTGKTTTVVKILALLLESSKNPIQIALAAPTGKAAMRLQLAIGNGKAALPCGDAVKERIPETVTTLHRLLGSRPLSPYFRHDTENPLPYDMVVVDEASMVDLALMSKFVAALKSDARLLLIGDKDQLASVESGAVLADLTTALPDQTVKLQKSHRFDQNIKALAEAVNQQQAKRAWEIFRSEAMENVSILKTDLTRYIAEKQMGYLRLLYSGAEFKAIYQAFSAFQVLCANRHGKNSVWDINTNVEKKLAEQNLIPRSGQWYPGRPVMVTQNDAGMHLYNGDIGICMDDTGASGRLMVFYERPDGSVKKYLPSRLPHCETVFAMTIHKSQGSEFDEVLIVMPEVMNPVLTKELLYTGITRAKERVGIVAGEEIFSEALGQKIRRYGGLVGKLRV